MPKEQGALEIDNQESTFAEFNQDLHLWEGILWNAEDARRVRSQLAGRAARMRTKENGRVPNAAYLSEGIAKKERILRASFCSSRVERRTLFAKSSSTAHRRVADAPLDF